MNFSVVLSVFHKDDPVFFDLALKSLVEQTIVPPEVIVVSDGPITDALSEVLQKYLTRYSFFVHIPCAQNMGPAHAWNLGIAAARYDWIARMDADDICIDERFEIQIAYIKSNPDISLLGGCISEFIMNPEITHNIRKAPLTLDKIVACSKKSNPFNHVTVFFSKAAHAAAGKYVQVDGFVDYYLWVRMLNLGIKAANVDRTLVKVRVGNDMVGRRIGLKYAKSEFEFNVAVMKIGFFTTMQGCRNIFLRCGLRLLPKFLVSYLYSLR
jgi:glycosyltransferase involved in cell wall biosynthesis